MFAWRQKHESLTFRLNLKERSVPVENTKCLFCGRDDEDSGHLFIKCKNAKAVWRELELEPEQRDLQEIPSVHHALDYIWSLSERKRMHILTFWWLWWSNRNKLREGELPESAEAVARRTQANVMQYEQIYSLPKAGQTPQRWRPPPDDMIKINADGSFIPGHEGSRWGVIARDAAGEAIEFLRPTRPLRSLTPCFLLASIKIPAAYTVETSSRLHSLVSPPALTQNSSIVWTVYAQAEEEAPPHEDRAQCSDEEYPFAHPDEVALDPPTEDWFWGQYNLAFWNTLPRAETTRQVALKKEWAEERTKNLTTCNLLSVALEKEELELWRRTGLRV
ncbi:Threonine dehydratase [Hordeum vulgare]|nr:Threonine dehydratase [Hordeum vulgare]